MKQVLIKFSRVSKRANLYKCRKYTCTSVENILVNIN